jgi:hypothetical protein
MPDMPRALTLEEEERWLKASLENKDHLLVHWYSVLRPGYLYEYQRDPFTPYRGHLSGNEGATNSRPVGAKNIHRLLGPNQQILYRPFHSGASKGQCNRLNRAGPLCVSVS